MTLRLGTRLSLYFLGALAAVLVGFSAALYLLADRDLHRQVDDRLDGVLNTLAAAAEVGPAGVEWEPAERTLSFGRHLAEGRFLWRVADERGRRLDGSTDDETEPLLGARGSPESDRRPRTRADARGGNWRVAHRRLLPRPGPAPPADPEGPPRLHPAVELGAAVSLGAVDAALRKLALTLAALGLAVEGLALVGCRRLCDRALRPLAVMAAAAGDIGGDAPHERLPVPPTGDELEELGRSFNALLDRLHESFERQRRFTGDASHQLRTPLTAIQGQVDLALRQDRPAEEYRRALGVVQRRTRHLSQIVEALLFLARADAEALQPRLDPVDLETWTPEHMDTRPDPNGAPTPRFETEGAGPFRVTAQPALLGDLLDNLLDNAGKYSPPGSPIVVRLAREGNDVTLAVVDRGSGIDPADLPHVFEPFYRADDARRRGTAGLGLGLAVAQRLARSFGGTLAAASRTGEGSTFTLRFPEAAAQTPVEPVVTPPARPAPP